VDFTASAHQYWAKNSSSGATRAVPFSGGPLVVHKSYVASALSVITSNSYTDVVLYVLDANTTIDVRHTLLTRPKVLLSNLSGYGSTIVNPLVAAGTPKHKTYRESLGTKKGWLYANRSDRGHPLRCRLGGASVVGNLFAQRDHLLLDLCGAGTRLFS
jgi:hypothetical protein